MAQEKYTYYEDAKSMMILTRMGMGMERGRSGRGKGERGGGEGVAGIGRTTERCSKREKDRGVGMKGS